MKTAVDGSHGSRVLAEQDGSFRRLVEMVKGQQTVLMTGRPGRPAKNRVPTTGHFAAHLYDKMKALAKVRSDEAGHLVSVSDLYNEAAVLLITDLHEMLGHELQLPAGVFTLSGILGLREVLNRPIATPLRELRLEADEQQRTTIHFDKLIWDALMEVSLRLALNLRRPLHVHRLLELASAWYLSGQSQN